MQAFLPLKQTFDDYLFAQRFDRKPTSLYQPFHYLFQLGGKRVRPVLLLAANQLLNGHINDALPAAMAIELFHNFSLIHDDIMDDATIRRGKPSVHEKFNTNTAILSGDVMFVYAFDYVQQTNSIDALQLFIETSKEVCEGQQLDMEFETRFDVTTAEYIQMITLKTAVLIGCSLKMGAMLANSEKTIQNALYQFGKNLGISFQIKDDILDTYASEESFGKKIGGDISQNKRTYLLIHALETAASTEKQELLNILSNNDNFDNAYKIKRVKEIYDTCNTKQKAERIAESFYQKAILQLNQLEEIGLNCSIFYDFAEQLLNRKK